MSESLKPCPFCGHSIDIEKDVYDPSDDWHPTFIDPSKNLILTATVGMRIRGYGLSNLSGVRSRKECERC